jgi:hypothetical protein
VGIGIAALIAAVFMKADFFGSSGPEKDPGIPPGGET